jgi:ribosomal protein S27AE
MCPWRYDIDGNRPRAGPDHLCARCGESSQVIMADGLEYCGVCAYILSGFIFNSYSLPYEKLFPHLRLEGVCGACSGLVYDEPGEYDWRNSIVYHHDCLQLHPASEKSPGDMLGGLLKEARRFACQEGAFQMKLDLYNGVKA